MFIFICFLIILFPFTFAYFYNMYSEQFPLPLCLCFQVPLLIFFFYSYILVNHIGFYPLFVFWQHKFNSSLSHWVKYEPIFPKVLFPGIFMFHSLRASLFSCKLFPHSKMNQLYSFSKVELLHFFFYKFYKTCS